MAEKRVIDLTTQPAYGFFALYIGGSLMYPAKDSVNHYIDFTMKKLSDAAMNCEFTIFDTDWVVSESLLAENYDNIEVEYGFTTGKRSIRYKLLLTNYSISFNMTGVFIHVKAVGESAIDNLLTKMELRQARGTDNLQMYRVGTPGYSLTMLNMRRPSDVVKAVCDYVGWTHNDSKFGETIMESTISRPEGEADPFVCSGMAPATFIKQYVEREAISVANGLPLHFHIDNNNNVWFVDKTVIDKVKKYVYQKGYDSPIKDLQVNTSGVFGGTTTTSLARSLDTDLIDPVSGDSTDNNDDYRYRQSIRNVVGDKDLNYGDASFEIIVSSGESKTQMEHTVDHLIMSVATAQITATMTIVGDPDLTLLDQIDLEVLMDNGDRHYVSGMYYILGITDKISNGMYLTTLKLARDDSDTKSVRKSQVLVNDGSDPLTR